jgi:hypothetical protein
MSKKGETSHLNESVDENGVIDRPHFRNPVISTEVTMCDCDCDM